VGVSGRVCSGQVFFVLHDVIQSLVSEVGVRMLESIINWGARLLYGFAFLGSLFWGRRLGVRLCGRGGVSRSLHM